MAGYWIPILPQKRPTAADYKESGEKIKISDNGGSLCTQIKGLKNNGHKGIKDHPSDPKKCIIAHESVQNILKIWIRPHTIPIATTIGPLKWQIFPRPPRNGRHFETNLIKTVIHPG